MFEVGKKVICIKAGRKSVLKQGKVYELLGIKKSPCKCGCVVLNVGIPPTTYDCRCIKCDTDFKGDEFWWFYSELFIPYDDSLSSFTADELIEQLEKQTTLI